MSITAGDLVKNALRKIGVLQTQEEPDADEMDDGLTTLNNMLHAWELDGIRLNHTDVVSTDTLPYPDNHTNPIMYSLCVQFCTEYGKPITAEIAGNGENGYRNLQNYYYQPDEMSVDNALHPYYATNRPYGIR